MKKFILLFCLAAECALGQSFAGFVNKVKTSAPPLRQAMVDSFMQANPVLPLRESDTLAHFIATGNFNKVEVAGDMNGWSVGQIVLQNIANTNFWYNTQVYEPTARLDYKLVTNGSNWILDPNNPHQVSGGFGPNSELAMPQYVQPWEIQSYAGVPAGSLNSYSIQSAALNASHQVLVYLPPSYDSTKAYPTAYFHDGTEYLNLGNARNVLDNLIDSALIEPLIGVFVKPNNRNEEYAMGKRFTYRNFFCDELVPWVDARFATRKDSSQRATIGASFGGNISALIAFTRPEVFYKAGFHSGAFWPNNYEALQIIDTSGVLSLPFASVWGSYEGSLPAVWRTVRDSMTSHQIPDKYFNEYPEGHSWGLWRATLDEILISLFPGSAGIGFQDRPHKKQWQVYPNPTRHDLRIEGLTETPVHYSIVGLDGHNYREGRLSGSTAQLDVQALPEGMYMLLLQHSMRQTAHLFVKM